MSDKNDKHTVVKAGFRTFIWILAAVMAGAIAIGDIEAPPAEEVHEAEVVESSLITVPDPVVEAGGEVQSLSFKKDMSIKDALRFLAAKYQKNIVPTASVDGVVTVTSLYDVTFIEALEAILGYGFKYDIKGNFIKVYTAQEYHNIKNDPSRMEQKVFTLYYVNATEMKKLITPALSENAIVAATTAPMQDTEAGDGGDSLAMRDTLVVFDYPENIDKVAGMIDSLDQRPPAILLEVTIMESQMKDDTEFGIDFSDIGATGAAFGLATGEGISSTGFASSVGGASGAGLSVNFKIDDVTGFIRALESITDTTVLANPKIMALNKQAGHILIGSEDGYLTTTQISSDGAVQTVEFLESGTRLKFRPFICRNGYIRMEINPEQSKGQVDTSSGFVLPSKDTTQVATNIMVKDGQTIVIGGLFKDDLSQIHSQVPVLGDIPIIGHAFENVKDVSIRTELIIMITPHIVEDPEELIDDPQVSDVQRLTQGAHDSLKAINRTKIYEDRLEVAQGYYKEGYLEAALIEVEGILDVWPNYPDALRLRDKIKDEVAGK